MTEDLPSTICNIPHCNKTRYRESMVFCKKHNTVENFTRLNRDEFKAMVEDLQSTEKCQNCNKMEYHELQCPSLQITDTIRKCCEYYEKKGVDCYWHKELQEKCEMHGAVNYITQEGLICGECNKPVENLQSTDEVYDSVKKDVIPLQKEKSAKKDFCVYCNRFLTKYESERNHPNHTIILKDLQKAESKRKHCPYCDRDIDDDEDYSRLHLHIEDHEFTTFWHDDCLREIHHNNSLGD